MQKNCFLNLYPLGLILALSLSNSLEARPYRYYLDANKMEQTLAGLTFGPRLGDDEWLRLLKFQKNEGHQIQFGDNLWNISKSRFGNPFLWRKLWQENPWLTNPHELTVGRALAYYHEEKAENVKRIPLIKLRPPKVGKFSDVDNDVYINRVVKTRYRVTYFVFNDEQFLGEITGAYTERINLRETDEIYAQIYDESKVSASERFGVVHEEKELRDKTLPGNPVIGKLMHLVAEVKLIRRGDDRTRIDVTGLFSTLVRGDKIVRLPEIASGSNPENPPNDLIARIILGEEPELKFFRQGGLVVLNKGDAEGMKVGYLFRVFRDTDPKTESTKGVDPTSKGEVRVIYTGRVSSLGFVLRNTEPLTIGDTLVPYRSLPDLPPTPKRDLHELEIN